MRHRFRAGVVAIALLTSACGSQVFMDAHAATPALTAGDNVAASYANGTVTIKDPSGLPEAVLQAGTLEVAFGGVKVPVMRGNAGYSFTVPSNARIAQDANGDLHVLFVMDGTTSQIAVLVPAPAPSPTPGAAS